VDRQLARVDVRTPLEKIWIDLQKPIRISDSLWLILQPSGVHLGRVRGSRETVGAQIGVTATPLILAGPKPVVASVPLPRLGPIQDAEGFSMLVEGIFDYSVMSGVLTEKLKGQKVKAAGETLNLLTTVFGWAAVMAGHRFPEQAAASGSWELRGLRRPPG
jgi:hypothetical protein